MEASNIRSFVVVAYRVHSSSSVFASAFFFSTRPTGTDASHLDRQKHKMSDAGGGCNKLFFGNISFEACEDDIKSLCEPYGDVEGKMRKEMPWSVLTSIDRVPLSASAFTLKF